MSFSPLINQLISAFKCLPGVGPKSAQRMAFHILERNAAGGQNLATCLQEAIAKVGHCGSCRTLCETEKCDLCMDPRRDQSKLCVVESPADIVALEQAGGYQGLYFVLLGHLSPLDGIGPEEIGVDEFQQKLQDGCVQEVIMATGTTVEGETTAYYLGEITKKLGINTTRIALGVPMGGDLENIDGGTLARAVARRSVLET